jgi:hypothetical protein
MEYLTRFTVRQRDGAVHWQASLRSWRRVGIDNSPKVHVWPSGTRRQPKNSCFFPPSEHCWRGASGFVLLRWPNLPTQPPTMESCKPGVDASPASQRDFCGLCVARRGDWQLACPQLHPRHSGLGCHLPTRYAWQSDLHLTSYAPSPAPDILPLTSKRQLSTVVTPTPPSISSPHCTQSRRSHCRAPDKHQLRSTGPFRLPKPEAESAKEKKNSQRWS